MAVQKLMIHQFGHWQSLLWVLMQALQDEILGRGGDGHTFGEINLLVDHLRKVILGSNFKGNTSVNEFVSKYPCLRAEVPMFQTSILLSYCCF